MKKYLFITIFLFFYAQKIFSQEINKTIFIESLKKEILLGLCDKEGLEKINFETNYELSKNESQLLSKINKKYAAEKIEFKVFIGSWCSDTQLHLPVFLTFYDRLEIEKKISMYALDLKKQSPNNDEVKYEITHVPTFIIFHNEKEIGRIIESPKKTIIDGVFKILKQI